MNLLRQNFLLDLSVYELESVLPAFVHPTYSLFTLCIWKSCAGRPRCGRWTKINVKCYWIISTFWCKRRSLNGTGSYHLTYVPHWKKKDFQIQFFSVSVRYCWRFCCSSVFCETEQEITGYQWISLHACWYKITRTYISAFVHFLGELSRELSFEESW